MVRSFRIGCGRLIIYLFCGNDERPCGILNLVSENPDGGICPTRPERVPAPHRVIKESRREVLVLMRWPFECEGHAPKDAMGGARMAWPTPFTFDDLVHACYEESKRAWDDGRREIASVTLPEGVFPELTQMQNPVTRSIIPVQRVPLITVGAEWVSRVP